MNIVIQFGRPRKDISIANQETRKGVKGQLERDWRKIMKRQYGRILGEVPLCCETCIHVGEKIWHCHCSQGPMYGINVHPDLVCSQWLPNQGLLMLLWKASADAYFKREDAKFKLKSAR